MEYLKIYESCRAIKGFTRSILYDLEKQNYTFIPNMLCDIIQNFDRKKLSDIHKNYKGEDITLVDEYISFIISKKFGFYCHPNEVERFIPLNQEWDSPSKITNAILHLDGVKENIKTVIKALDDLLCHHIMIVCNDELDLHDITLEHVFEGSGVKSIILKMPYKDESQENEIKTIMENNVRIKVVYLHSATVDEVFYSNGAIHQKAIKIVRDTFCSIHSRNFITNLPFFTESQSHNTCLNRKLCIDAEGNIKNCPEMGRSFGNIKDTTLKEAIEKPGFKDLWFIHKDQIDVCKDCEFRHACTDCRCFIKDPENIYSQPAKCTYNPYICKWQGEEGYIPVEECGSYNKETGFIPDKEKIEQLNKQIWEE